VGGQSASSHFRLQKALALPLKESIGVLKDFLASESDKECLDYARFSLALRLQQNRNTDEALEVFRAIASDLTSPWSLYAQEEIGTIFYLMGESHVAEAELLKALNMCSGQDSVERITDFLEDVRGRKVSVRNSGGA